MLNSFTNITLSSLKMLHVAENQFWQALKLSLTQTNIFNLAVFFSLIFYFLSFAKFILK